MDGKHEIKGSEQEQGEGQRVVKEDQEETPRIDPLRLNMLMNRLREEQSIIKGFAGGAVGAAIGAAIWAAITILTQFQVGYMALAVGFLAGMGVRILGKGVDRSFQYLGAVLSLAGCMVGNLAVVIILVSDETGLGVFDLVSKLNPGVVMEIFLGTFDFIDLIFYGLAISVGYSTSLFKVPDSELDKLVVE